MQTQPQTMVEHECFQLSFEFCAADFHDILVSQTIAGKLF